MYGYSKKRLVAVVAAFVLAGSAACSAEGSAGGESADTDAILRVGVDLTSGGGPTFDPAQPLVTISGQDMWRDLIFDRLVYRDENDQLTPGLLESWDIPDPLTLELTVREGVTFHDGTRLDAEALRFNWERLLDESTVTVPADFAALEDMEVVSPRVLKLSYSRPVASYALHVTMSRSLGFGTIVSPTAVEKLGDDFDSAPVGAGPYEFAKYEPGRVLSLRRFDEYWGKESPKLGGVDFLQLARGAAAVSALASGRVDLARIDKGSISAVEGRDELVVHTKLTNELLVLVLNVAKPPFDNPITRQGLAYALDRSEINKGAYAGLGSETEFLYYDGSSQHPADLDSGFEYDPERAKELLAKGGATPGTELTLVVQTQSEMEVAAELLQAQLAEVGIEVKIQVAQNWIPAISDHPDSFILSVTNFLIPTHYLTSGSIIDTGYRSPEFDELHAAVQGATTEKELLAANRALQQKLVADLPVFPIAQEPFTIGAKDTVHGLGNARYDAVELRDAWIAR